MLCICALNTQSWAVGDVVRTWLRLSVVWWQGARWRPRRGAACLLTSGTSHRYSRAPRDSSRGEGHKHTPPTGLASSACELAAGRLQPNGRGVGLVRWRWPWVAVSGESAVGGRRRHRPCDAAGERESSRVETACSGGRWMARSDGPYFFCRRGPTRCRVLRR